MQQDGGLTVGGSGFGVPDIQVVRISVQSRRSKGCRENRYRLAGWGKFVLIQSVHFTFAPEDAGKAEAILRELRDASRKEHGVIGFDVARSRENPNVFALWEHYRDAAALDAHRETDHFKRLVLDGVRPLAQERKAEQLVSI